MHQDRNTMFDPDEPDHFPDRFERLLDEADRIRTERKDRQMEEMWEKKEKEEGR